MARRSKGSVYRKTKAVIRGGKRRTVKAGFYRARYRDARGELQDHVLVLPNGQRIKEKSVAEAEIDKILRRVERQAAGLIDSTVEAASLPIRSVVARFIRHLRGSGVGRRHISQVVSYLKWMIEHADMRRLADFNVEKLDRALHTVAAKGRSPRTVNVYRQCAHALGEWAIAIDLLDRNPVAKIKRRDERADTRKVRRSLTADEAYKLLKVAGPRELFYAVGLWTGLRVAETLALEWRDLDLDPQRPALRLRAATTKAKRADVLPLHQDLMVALASAKPPFAAPTDRVFKTAPRLKTFKRDLGRAGIPFEDDQGRTVDRHALRTTFISWLGFYGVDPRAQVMLARHTPQGITFKHYQDFSLFDLWADIGKLPPIRPTTVAQDTERATGTDGAVARPVALRLGREGVKQSATGRIDTGVPSPHQQEKGLQNKRKTAFSRPSGDSGRQDSNLRLPAPKAGALPDCATPRIVAEAVQNAVLDGVGHESTSSVVRCPLLSIRPLTAKLPPNRPTINSIVA